MPGQIRFPDNLGIFWKPKIKAPSISGPPRNQWGPALIQSVIARTQYPAITTVR
jgi:hypothetical protein